jgi:ATP-dependent helicase HrpB
MVAQRAEVDADALQDVLTRIEAGAESLTAADRALIEKVLDRLAPEAEADEISGPEAQVKLTECFQLKTHPTVGEDAIPIRLALQAPDGKRLEVVSNFPRWREISYPKLRAQIRTKYPGFVWP